MLSGFLLAYQCAVAHSTPQLEALEIEEFAVLRAMKEIWTGGKERESEKEKDEKDENSHWQGTVSLCN